MSFPYHQVPDGSVAVPHHYTWALLLALIPLALIWDDESNREPWVAATAIVIGLIGFLYVWPTHHVLGAVIAVAATILAAGTLVVRLLWLRGDWPIGPLLVALLLVLVASDDVLHHAFGWAMPLDIVWTELLRPRLPSHTI